MPVETAAIRKNGQELIGGLRVWVSCAPDESGKEACWGYMNPDWEAPIGRLDPEGEADPRYELVLASGDALPIRVWDHRDEHFLQFIQNGYRTIRFQTI